MSDVDAIPLAVFHGTFQCAHRDANGLREMLQSLWPEWFEETIGCLEREAEAAGIPGCRWGERPPGAEAAEGGPLCSSCDWRQLVIEEAA